MLPYKVVYAARLAEAGLIAPAVHYVGLVQAALASFGAKVPPGLLVCRAMVAELEERLRTHASVCSCLGTISLKSHHPDNCGTHLLQNIDLGILCHGCCGCPMADFFEKRSIGIVKRNGFKKPLGYCYPTDSS